jgi:hypothetical protein
MQREVRERADGAGSCRRPKATSTLDRKKSTAILPSDMALNIKDDGADRLVRELAAETGESLTTAITVAVRERLERHEGMRILTPQALLAELVRR